MRTLTVGKVLAASSCVLGLVACWLMWHEAGLPPNDRPLRLFGASGGRGISSEIYPESGIVFSGGIFVVNLLSILGLVRSKEVSVAWHWGPAFLIVGVLVLIFLHQARRVNSVSLEVVQLGYVLGLLAGAGLLASGVVTFVFAWRTSPVEPGEATHRQEM